MKILRKGAVGFGLVNIPVNMYASGELRATVTDISGHPSRATPPTVVRYRFTIHSLASLRLSVK